MTRIAFCDDDAALLHQMQDFLEQYRTLRGVQLELAPYTKPMELLADIEAGVQFTVQAGISQALPVSESDLCVLLSNALENALHAAVRCREAGQGAFIETTGHEKGKKLFLQITNSCLPDVQFREGVPVTDRTGHGLGVRSICAISERYGGLTSFAAKDGHHFMVDLDQGPCAIKRLSGCGAGHEYLAVAPNGDIYPCHQFVGNKDFLMGNVNENKIDENIEKMFERSNVYTKEKCKNCFAKFYCSGGCSANAYNFNGDINKPYELACEFEKKRLECSIAIEAHKKLS